MRLKGRREAHNREFVERATRKCLKSLAAKKSFSPFRTIRAITLKLCSHSRPTAIENHPASKLCPALNSRKRAPRLRVPFPPRFRPYGRAMTEDHLAQAEKRTYRPPTTLSFIETWPMVLTNGKWSTHTYPRTAARKRQWPSWWGFRGRQASPDY